MACAEIVELYLKITLMKMMKMVEGIIEWEDREVLRRVAKFFQEENVMTKSEWNIIIKEVRKPQVDIEKEMEDE